MLSRSIRLVLLTCLVSSCPRETAVPIESAFSIESSEEKVSPVTIQLKNESYGADEYEWTFFSAVPIRETWEYEPFRNMILTTK